MDRQKSALRGSLRRSVLPAAALLVFSWALQARAQADWTFMVYLDGDNDLEKSAINDFLEMAQVGSDSSLNIVVQFDRKKGDLVTSWDDWGTCKRFSVTSGMWPTAAAAVADLGEINMADPAELTAFINWTVANYEAANYALVIWNHGNGWYQGMKAPTSRQPRNPLKAVLYDETSDACMSIAGVRAALAGANVEIDLLGFDACLMGMMEVAYQLRNVGPTTALSGDVNFVNGNDQVLGIGTQFLTEVTPGQYIRRNDEGVWARVLSVTDDTNLTLTANYTGVGNAGYGAGSIRTVRPDDVTALTGTVTFTNGSAVVVGDSTQFQSVAEVAAGQYVRLDADGIWVEVLSVDSDTQLTLVDLYTGAGNTAPGGAGSIRTVRPDDVTALTGTVTFTNDSAVVVGDSTQFQSVAEVTAGQYVRLDADGIWVEVLSVDSDTQLTLVDLYTGAGNTAPGGAGSVITPPPVDVTPLTGTLTFTNGNTAVTGTGTQFQTLSEVTAGQYVRLDADDVWAEVASVTDDANLTLAAPYTGAGNTAPGGAGSVRAFPPVGVTALTGTLHFAGGSDVVQGTDTLFTTEVTPGQYIRRDDEGVWARVLSITNDTQLTLAALYTGLGSVDYVAGSVRTDPPAGVTALTGTVNFTGDSDQVVGTGTLFETEAPVGCYVRRDDEGVWAEVLSVQDDTHLTLEGAYTGVGNADSAAGSVMHPARKVIVFSEDTIMLSPQGEGGWPYHTILAKLQAADPAMTATDLGMTIADDFYDYYSALETSTEEEYVYTHSVVRLSELDKLATDVGNLALQLTSAWDSKPAAVKAAAQTVLDSLESAVVHERHDVDTPGAGGLTIYFPSILDNLDPTYRGTTLDFMNDTAWDEFLSTGYYASMIGSWVSDARRKAQEFDEDTFVDLKDFCERLVNHATGCYYVDLIPAEQTGVPGPAKGWQADDECWEYTLPFSFPFFGQSYWKVWVCDNGFLEFATIKPSLDQIREGNSMAALKTRKMIAPLWADLYTTDGNIFVHPDDPGTPTYVCIRWDAKDYELDEIVEFEVLLYKDGRIQFNYLAADNHKFFSGYRDLMWYPPPPTAGVSAGDGEHYEPSFYDFVWDLKTTDSETYTPCAPEITSFTADPDTPIVSGDPVTLAWVTQDMVSVSIDKGVGDDLDLSGSSDPLTPAETTIYTLTAVDPLGIEHTDFVTVQVVGLTLVDPAGGEVIVGNHIVAITWTSSEFTGQVKIEFDDGQGGGYVVLDTVADSGSYDWDVPNQDLPAWAESPTHQCKIKISHDTNGVPLDESGLFSIHADGDFDGMPDGWETNYGLNPGSSGDAGTSADSDTLTNLEEYEAGTNPTKPDTDGDSLLDDWELQYTNGIDQLLPTVADSDGIGTTDDGEDHDGDSLTNLEEQTAGTDPTSEDTDGDRLPDDWELGYFDPGPPTRIFDPTLADSDDDGEADDLEDTDGDGKTNYWEWEHNTDPTDDLDPPPPGTTKPGGCSGEGAGSTGSFAWLVLALAAGLASSKRRTVTA